MRTLRNAPPSSEEPFSMRMFRSGLYFRSALIFLPLLAWTQETAPPPELDQALRERCTQFFTYHTDTETQKTNFRKAWELVAEESKDFYFSGHKQTYKSFKIDNIKYSDNFT